MDAFNLLILQSKRETMMFYPIDPSEKYGLFALRLGKYKAHFYTQGTRSYILTTAYWHCQAWDGLDSCLFIFTSGTTHSGTTPDKDCPASAVLKDHDPPLIFDLEADPSENYPLRVDTPDIETMLQQIQKVKQQFEASMVFGESQISKGTDPNLEPCCNPQCSPKPTCCHCWWDRLLQLLMKTLEGMAALHCCFLVDRWALITVHTEEEYAKNVLPQWCDFLLFEYCYLIYNVISSLAFFIIKALTMFRNLNNEDNNKGSDIKHIFYF